MFENLSKAGHVKSCLNMGGPPSKPKYYLSTDSEQVPWGKGEKNPKKGSEIESEIKSLWAVGARPAMGCVTAYLLYNGSVS